MTVGDEKINVKVEASEEIELSSEAIQVNGPAYTRIGISLKKSTKKGHISLLMY
ncbi:MAG: hypothetical protein LUE99_13300 [Bacteroides sp.]|nr:hypothetical protein [Bacteroides sp.]